MPNRSASIPINSEAMPNVPIPIAPSVVNTVGNCSFGTLVCTTVCCGIFFSWLKIPTRTDKKSAIAGTLFNPNSTVAALLKIAPVKMKRLRLFSIHCVNRRQIRLPMIKPIKNDPLIKPHHCSSAASASLTKTYKIAAIHTAPAIVSSISITAMRFNTGVLETVFQPWVI